MIVLVIPADDMKKILIFSLTPGWVGISRLPKALKQEGYNVVALCQPSSYLAKTQYVDNLYLYKNQVQFKRLYLKILAKNKIDMVVPGDDLSVSYQIQILEKNRWYHFRYKKIQNIILDSCNNKAALKVLSNKSALQDLSERLGILTPSNRQVASLVDLEKEMFSRKFPVVLKSDFGVSGSGVRICNNVNELFQAYNELYSGLLRRNLISLLRIRIKRIFGLPIFLRDQNISIQDYVDGNLCVTSLFASNGKILSMFSYKTIYSYPTKTSASSAIQVIENKHAKQAVEKLVSKTGFTGFASFDFILDENDIATLIECNARPTPVVHLSHFCGANLCAVVKAHFGEDLFKEPYPPVKKPLIALFPNELKRDKNSKVISEAFHDVPFDDPKLLDCFSQELKELGISVVSKGQQVVVGSPVKYP